MSVGLNVGRFVVYVDVEVGVALPFLSFPFLFSPSTFASTGRSRKAKLNAPFGFFFAAIRTKKTAIGVRERRTRVDVVRLDKQDNNKSNEKSHEDTSHRLLCRPNDQDRDAVNKRARSTKVYNMLHALSIIHLNQDHLTSYVD